MIDPGKMRCRINFQKFDGTRDAHGEIRDDVDANWDIYTTVWAAVDPVSGRELVSAGQEIGEITHKIRCRWVSGVESSMRIKFGTRKFKIQSIMNWEERNESFLIYAKEIVK